MPDALDVLSAIRHRTDTLNPVAVLTAHSELIRGGYPAMLMPEPVRSSERPIPVSQAVVEKTAEGVPSRWGQIGPADRVDRDARKRAKRYVRHLEQALRELDAAIEHQSWFLQPSRAVPDDGPAVACANLACDQVLEPGRQKGECSRCRVHRHRHGTTWPRQIS